MVRGKFTSDIMNRNLVDWLAASISDFILCWQTYENNKDSEDVLHRVTLSAFHCIALKNKLIGYGFLTESPSLTTKIKQHESEIQQLKERLEKCNERCQQLTEENKTLREFQDKIGYIGDVFRYDNE